MDLTYYFKGLSNNPAKYSISLSFNIPGSSFEYIDFYTEDYLGDITKMMKDVRETIENTLNNFYILN